MLSKLQIKQQMNLKFSLHIPLQSVLVSNLVLIHYNHKVFVRHLISSFVNKSIFKINHQKRLTLLLTKCLIINQANS